MSNYRKKLDRKDWDIRYDIDYHEELARLESENKKILDELEVVKAYEEIDAIRKEKNHRKVDTALRVAGGVGKVLFIGALTVVSFMFETDNVYTRKGIGQSIRNTMQDIGFNKK